MNDLTKISLEDLTALHLKDLISLQSKVNQAIDRRKSSEKNELLQKFNAMASESGFSLNELMSATTKFKKAPAPAKYKNPANQNESWSGKGRKPNWVVDLLANGTKLEDFEI